MAASAWDPRQPRIFTPGGVTEIRDFPEGSTQSYKAGSPVKLSSGKIVVATDGTTGLLGIAQEDASGTASTMQAVQVVRPHQDLILAQTVSAGTLTSASGLTRATAYDFYKNTSTGVFYADKAATSGPILIFVDYVRDVNGDTTYWGIFEVLAGQAGNLDSAGA